MASVGHFDDPDSGVESAKDSAATSPSSGDIPKIPTSSSNLGKNEVRVAWSLSSVRSINDEVTAHLKRSDSEEWPSLPTPAANAVLEKSLAAATMLGKRKVGSDQVDDEGRDTKQAKTAAAVNGEHTNRENGEVDGSGSAELPPGLDHVNGIQNGCSPPRSVPSDEEEGSILKNQKSPGSEETEREPSPSRSDVDNLGSASLIVEESEKISTVISTMPEERPNGDEKFDTRAKQENERKDLAVQPGNLSSKRDEDDVDVPGKGADCVVQVSLPDVQNETRGVSEGSEINNLPGEEQVDLSVQLSNRRESGNFHRGNDEKSASTASPNVLGEDDGNDKSVDTPVADAVPDVRGNSDYTGNEEESTEAAVEVLGKLEKKWELEDGGQRLDIFSITLGISEPSGSDESTLQTSSGEIGVGPGEEASENFVKSDEVAVCEEQAVDATGGHVKHDQTVEEVEVVGSALSSNTSSVAIAWDSNETIIDVQTAKLLGSATQPSQVSQFVVSSRTNGDQVKSEDEPTETAEEVHAKASPAKDVVLELPSEEHLVSIETPAGGHDHQAAPEVNVESTSSDRGVSTWSEAVLSSSESLDEFSYESFPSDSDTSTAEANSKPFASGAEPAVDEEVDSVEHVVVGKLETQAKIAAAVGTSDGDDVVVEKEISQGGGDTGVLAEDEHSLSSTENRPKENGDANPDPVFLDEIAVKMVVPSLATCADQPPEIPFSSSNDTTNSSEEVLFEHPVLLPIVEQIKKESTVKDRIEPRADQCSTKAVTFREELSFIEPEDDWQNRSYGMDKPATPVEACSLQKEETFAEQLTAALVKEVPEESDVERSEPGIEQRSLSTESAGVVEECSSAGNRASLEEASTVSRLELIRCESLEVDAEETDDEYEDETAYERLVGLTEMFPETLIDRTKKMVSFSVSALKTVFNFGRNATWVVCSSSLILFAPLMFEVERVRVLEAQKEHQTQMLLGPSAARGAAGGMVPPLSMGLPPQPPPRT